MAEVTAFRNNALPYPVYGVPWTIVLPILDADGDPVTDGTIDSLVSINGDTAGAGATPVQIATTTGLFYLVLTASQMTADIVSGSIGSTTSGAKRTLFVLYPRKLVQLATGTSQGGAAGYITLAAGAVAFNGQFNGCLCVATIDTNAEARILQVCTASNQQCTVTPGWNVSPDADDTYIIYLPEGLQYPTANLTQWLGVAPLALSSQQVQAVVPTTQKVDVETIKTKSVTVDAGGTTFPASIHASGAAVAKSPATLAAGDVTGNLPANVAAILATALTESSAGYLAASFKKLLDVATPVLTAASVNQTGDVFAIIGGTPVDGKSLIAALRYIAAVTSGKSSGANTGTEKYRGLDGSTERVEAVIDASGNRTTVTYDPV